MQPIDIAPDSCRSKSAFFRFSGRRSPSTVTGVRRVLSYGRRSVIGRVATRGDAGTTAARRRV